MPLRVDLIEYGGLTIAAMGVVGAIKIRRMEGLPMRFSLDMIKEHKHLGMQVIFVLIATWIAVSIENDLTLGLGLSGAKQFVVWILFLQSFATWWWSERKPFERVLSIFLSFGSAFVLFSVNFESLFYAFLGVTLFFWIELENKIRESAGDRQSDVHKLNVTTACVLLILTEISFFGTGNMASVSSFKIKSVTRFFVEYHPFVMMALLLIKLVIPFFLVSGAFALICVRNKIQQFNVFLMTVGLCDLMALALYFLVRDEGSWKDIGDSLSRFVIINCMVLFFLMVLLFAQVFMAGISQKKPEDKKEDDHLP
jgi:GPI ethanolamine phosphate transferase 1